MRVEEGQVFFHCQYCNSYEFPNPNEDGVALLEQLSPCPCPLCHEPLVSAVIKDIPILSCPHCRGNLIAQSKMLPILRQAPPPDPIVEEIPSPPNKTELTRTVVCPACQKVMAVYPYGGAGNVIIQGCEPCELIWLDFGELSKMLRSYHEIYDHSSDELGAKKKWIAF